MMKKFCIDKIDSDNVVTLRRPSRNTSLEIDFTGVEETYQDLDEDVNEVKAAVEKILADVKADRYEPLPLATDFLRFEEPLVRLRAFMENNDSSLNSSAMAVNGPCKHPVQALRTFLDR